MNESLTTRTDRAIVEAYVGNVPVMYICQLYGINVHELNELLKDAGIPTRKTGKKQ